VYNFCEYIMTFFIFALSQNGARRNDVLSNYCCFYFRLFELIMNKVRYCLHLLIVVDLSLWQYYPTACTSTVMTHLPSNFCECKPRLTILKPVNVYYQPLIDKIYKSQPTLIPNLFESTVLFTIVSNSNYSYL
jgi:hypothetical protein